jgi:hypothetical protein
MMINAVAVAVVEEFYRAMAMDQQTKPRVVIVGVGFGGLFAARTLARYPVQITLVDRQNFHIFQPLLYLRWQPPLCHRTKLPHPFAGCRTGSMGIWHSRPTTGLRGNRFYRRPERSHCFGLSLFRQSSLKQNAQPLPRLLTNGSQTFGC